MTINSNVQVASTFITSSGAASTTMTQNLSCQPLDLSRVTSGLIEIRWTGTPVGNFQILGSTDGVNYNATLLATSNPLAAAGGAAGSLTGVWTYAAITTKQSV